MRGSMNREHFMTHGPMSTFARFKRNEGGRTNAIEGVLQGRRAQGGQAHRGGGDATSVAKARHSRTFPFLSMELEPANGAD